MMINGPKIPPGPKGLPFLGLALEVRKDPLGTLRRAAQQYGDVVSLPVLGTNRVLVNWPEYIQQLLILEHLEISSRSQIYKAPRV